MKVKDFLGMKFETCKNIYILCKAKGFKYIQFDICIPLDETKIFKDIKNENNFGFTSSYLKELMIDSIETSSEFISLNCMIEPQSEEQRKKWIQDDFYYSVKFYDFSYDPKGFVKLLKDFTKKNPDNKEIYNMIAISVRETFEYFLESAEGFIVEIQNYKLEHPGEPVYEFDARQIPNLRKKSQSYREILELTSWEEQLKSFFRGDFPYGNKLRWMIRVDVCETIYKKLLDRLKDKVE